MWPIRFFWIHELRMGHEEDVRNLWYLRPGHTLVKTKQIVEQISPPYPNLGLVDSDGVSNAKCEIAYHCLLHS
jgi:hypothetical protein